MSTRRPIPPLLRQPIFHLCLATGLCLSASPLSAADLQGARGLIEAVQQASTAEEPEEEKKATPLDAFGKKVDDFAREVGSLSDQEAATRWLGLMDELDALSAVDKSKGFQDLFKALPPPRTWKSLAGAVEARPSKSGDDQLVEIGLRLLAHTLVNDAGARAEDIEQLTELASKLGSEQQYALRSIQQSLERAILDSAEDPEMILNSLERQLIKRAGQDSGYLNLPNLVSVVGEAKAEAFLRKAIQSDVRLNISGNNRTAILVRKLALELIDELKQPQWNLANSLQAVELYEAMEEKFAKPAKPAPTTTTPSVPGFPNINLVDEEPDDYQKAGARMYYMLGLITRDRIDDAIEVAKVVGKGRSRSLDPNVLKQLHNLGFTQQVNRFFHRLLSENPDLAFWDQYIEVAAHAQDTDRMLTLAREVAGREEVGEDRKIAISKLLARALLANGNIDEGVEELRRNIGLSSKAGKEVSDSIERMASLGLLLERPAWVEEALQDTAKARESASEPDANLDVLAAILHLEQGNPTEAEALLRDGLAKSVRKQDRVSSRSYYGRETSPDAYLLSLARLYDQFDRHEDVLALFEDAPWWAAADLAQVHASVRPLSLWSRDKYGYLGSGDAPTLMVARALTSNGRKEEALKLVNAALDRNPGKDEAYELLLEVTSEAEAMARLDELFARDQFEERPLIWKAELLRRQGKLDEAETTARRAIAIDPSDGEQGRGDRMRVYAVLGDVLEAKGIAGDAEVMRGAVAAIRLSEDADRYHAAGLLSQAVGMYRESLGLFADAYCIQSRLALQLAELGDFAAAEEHYRRAYELMPGSFGRVESHCFGCERAFSGERAQGIAERTFQRMAEETPDKPQVHYLLGYLREEQGRYADAVPHVQRAVELDPDYLNAWVKLSRLANNSYLPLEERHDIVRNILRLDPAHRHSHVRLTAFPDLVFVWNSAERARAIRPEFPKTIFPLAASAAALKEKAQGNSMDSFDMSYYDPYSQETDTPASAIRENGFITAAITMMSPRSGSYW